MLGRDPFDDGRRIDSTGRLASRWQRLRGKRAICAWSRPRS